MLLVCLGVVLLVGVVVCCCLCIVVCCVPVFVVDDCSLSLTLFFACCLVFVCRCSLMLSVVRCRCWWLLSLWLLLFVASLFVGVRRLLLVVCCLCSSVVVC